VRRQISLQLTDRFDTLTIYFAWFLQLMSHGVQVAFVGYAKSFVIKSQPPFFHPFSLPTTYAYSWGNDYSDQLTLYPIDIALAHNIPRMFIGQCCVECSCLWICHWPPLGIVKIICLETQFSWLVGHIFMVHFVSRGKCIFPNLWFTMVFPWRNFWNSLRARWGKMCGKYESL